MRRHEFRPIGRPAGLSALLIWSTVCTMALMAGSATPSAAQSSIERPLPFPPANAGAMTAASAERLAGFERRRASGRGVFVTSADLHRRRAGRLSDFLRAVPGVALVPLDGMGFAVASSRPGWHPRIGMDAPARNACFLDVLLDGVSLSPAPTALPLNIDDVAPSRLAAIEIHRASAIPIELPVGPGSCGVIALWSRD